MLTIALQVQDPTGRWCNLNMRRVHHAEEKQTRIDLRMLLDGWRNCGFFADDPMRIARIDADAPRVRQPHEPIDWAAELAELRAELAA